MAVHVLCLRVQTLLTSQFSWCCATSDYSESTCLSFKVSSQTLTCLLNSTLLTILVTDKSLKHHNLLIQSFQKIQNVDQLFARNDSKVSISAAESNDYSRWPEHSQSFQSSRRSAANSVANHASNLKYANSHCTTAKTRRYSSVQHKTLCCAASTHNTSEPLCREALVQGSSLLHPLLWTTKTTMLGNVLVTVWTFSWQKVSLKKGESSWSECHHHLCYVPTFTSAVYIKQDS